jgi:hypothetical protein
MILIKEWQTFKEILELKKLEWLECLNSYIYFRGVIPLITKLNKHLDNWWCPIFWIIIFRIVAYAQYRHTTSSTKLLVLSRMCRVRYSSLLCFCCPARTEYQGTVLICFRQKKKACRHEKRSIQRKIYLLLFR